MTKPKQRVVLYRHGLRKKTMAEYNNEYRLAMEGYFECPKCKRAVRKGANGNLKKHFSDFPNRIHCPEGKDNQNDGGANKRKGVKRGPYGPRKTKTVIDKDRKPVESLYK